MTRRMGANFPLETVAQSGLCVAATKSSVSAIDRRPAQRVFEQVDVARLSGKRSPCYPWLVATSLQAHRITLFRVFLSDSVT